MNGDFIIHIEDYGDAILGLPAESAGRLFLSLVTYAKGEEVGSLLDDDLLARSIFHIMKSHIDRDKEYKERKSRAGRKGGAPIGNSNALKQPKTTKNNQKQTENKQKQTPNPKPNPKPKYKRPYGECANVNLTDEEYQSLKDKNLLSLIDELSLYIASKGDKYKSHYATILQWSRKREKEKAPIKETAFTSGAKGADYDFAEILKRKVVN